MIVEFHNGLYFPEEFNKYKLRFSWGEFNLDTLMVDALDPETDRKWYFYERLTIKAYLPYSNDNIDELPDVFIYLINQEETITGFYRRPAKDFLVNTSVPESIAFKPNHQKFPKMAESQAGSCVFRAYINHESIVMEKIKKNRWIKPLARIDRPKGILQINLYQANDILAADSSGLSCPYFKFYYNGQCIKSHVINDTLSPIWDQGLKLEIDFFEDIKTSPFIFIELFDKKIMEADLMIGWTRVQVHDFQVSQNPVLISYPTPNEKPVIDVKPDWVKLQHSGMPAGKALVSFIFIPKQYEDLAYKDTHTPLSLPTSEYKMKFRIIGLRGLVSNGVLPVSKAFLTFDVQSLQKKPKIKEQQFMHTIPKQQGDSPNIITMLESEVELPTNIDYMPNMQVYCYDSLMGGLTKSLIGNFQIDLKEAIENTINRVNKIKEHLKELEIEKQQELKLQKQKELQLQKQQKKSNRNSKINQTLAQNDQSDMIQIKQSAQAQNNQQIQVKQQVQDVKKSTQDQQDVKKSTQDQQDVKKSTQNNKDKYIDKSNQNDKDNKANLNDNKLQDNQQDNSFLNQSQDQKENQTLIPQKKKSNLIINIDHNDNEIINSMLSIKSQKSVQFADNLQQSKISGKNSIKHEVNNDKNKIQTPKQNRIELSNITENKIEQSDISNNNINAQSYKKCSMLESQVLNENDVSIPLNTDIKKIQKLNSQPDVQILSQIQNTENIQTNKNNNIQVSQFKPDIKEQLQQPQQPQQQQPQQQQPQQSQQQQPQQSQPQQDNKQQPQQDNKQQPQQDNKQQPQQSQAQQDNNQQNQQPSGTQESEEIDLNNQQEDAGKPLIVIPAKYKKIPANPENKYARFVEDQIPDYTKYLGIGYDNKDVRKAQVEKNYKKHYRLLLDHPLEESEYMDKILFSEIDVMHKNALEQGGFFSQKIGKHLSPVRGLFKGWLDVYRLDYEEEYNKYISSTEDMSFLNSQKVNVRLYIFKFKDIVGVDSNGESSPYLKLKCGNFQVDEHDQFVKDVDEFDKLQMYQFTAQIPGPPLTIQLWHHNMLEEDQEIGSNNIDLEDRWFSKKWKAKIEHPIETRQLLNDDTQLDFGCVQCMCQIYNQKDEKKIPLWNLNTKPIKLFELRVVIWKSLQVRKVDGDFNDLKVKVKFGNIEQGTDTHWRSQTGQGTWNWRVVIPIEYPLKDQETTIRFQICEESLLESDEPVAEAEYDIKDLLDTVYDNDVILKKKVKNNLKFEVDTILNPSLQNKYNEEAENSDSIIKKKITTGPTSGGKLQVSVYLFPQKEATNAPQGLGRENPNSDPHLPNPPDRLKMSLDPVTMFDEFVPPEERDKLKLLCCCICVCFLFFMMLPVIFGNVISSAITSI